MIFPGDSFSYTAPGFLPGSQFSRFYDNFSHPLPLFLFLALDVRMFTAERQNLEMEKQNKSQASWKEEFLLLSHQNAGKFKLMYVYLDLAT